MNDAGTKPPTDFIRQIIHDDLEYFSCTHHTNMDTLDRLQEQDLIQAAIVIASVVVVIFSAMGGLRGVLITDFLLFVLSMGGAMMGLNADGCNPLLGPCSGPTAVKPTTWGRLKTKFTNEN